MAEKSLLQSSISVSAKHSNAFSHYDTNSVRENCKSLSKLQPTQRRLTEVETTRIDFVICEMTKNIEKALLITRLVGQGQLSRELQGINSKEMIARHVSLLQKLVLNSDEEEESGVDLTNINFVEELRHSSKCLVRVLRQRKLDNAGRGYLFQISIFNAELRETCKKVFLEQKHTSSPCIF